MCVSDREAGREASLLIAFRVTSSVPCARPPLPSSQHNLSSLLALVDLSSSMLSLASKRSHDLISFHISSYSLINPPSPAAPQPV